MERLYRLRSALTKELATDRRYLKELQHFLSYAEDPIEKRALRYHIRDTRNQIRKLTKALRAVQNVIANHSEIVFKRILPAYTYLGKG